MWRRMYQPLMALAAAFVIAGGSQALARDEEVVRDIDHAWVKLFDKSDYTGERLSINYPKEVKDMHRMSSDRGERGAENMVQSAHFAIPRGWALRIYRDPDFRGEHIDLVGTGRPERQKLDRLSNRASSLRWIRVDRDSDRDRDYRRDRDRDRD